VQNPDIARPTERSFILSDYAFRWRHYSWAGIAVALTISAAQFTHVEAAAITAGNLVVYRVGDGTAALGTAATAVFLDEYTVTGTLVQTIPLPTAGISSLTAVGNATTEGIMTLSQNGSSLIFTGYRKDAGGTSPSGDTPAATNRIIASVGLSGVVDTSIALTDVAGTIRSAATVDGSSYYIGASTGGVRYAATPGPATTSVQIDSRNSREVLLNGNTLYASNGSTAITPKVQSYGTLPTGATAPTPLASLALGDAVNGFSLFDLDATIPGVDTMYLLSTVENLLRKYTLDGLGTWNASGAIGAGGAQNLTGLLNGGAVNLYLSTGTGIRPFTDGTGYNGLIDGLTLDAAIATAPTNTAFRGIAIISVPEPTAAALLITAAAGMLAWRRRR
jgi:hypothetical protein